MEHAKALEERVVPIRGEEKTSEAPKKQASFPIFGILILFILLALAGNTLLQLQLGKAIHSKAQQLDQGLRESADLSQKMNAQLGLISQLNDATTRLSGKLNTVKGNTQGLAGEIARLDKVVAGIGATVARIDGNTRATKEQLLQINQALSESAAMLDQMVQINDSVVGSLKQIGSVQQQINANLGKMNDKTKILEHTAILEKLGILK
jgi:methyl-accepting chemotaxis protein